MRRHDKKILILKANTLSEQRHLKLKGGISEERYESRDDLEGYVDAQDLIGEYLWFHTNRTHRNNNKNGMIGIYKSSNKGRKTGSPIGYTNEVRLNGPIYFQTSESGSNSIQKTGHRVLIAGVSGVVTNTRNDDTSGMEEATYDPFDAGVFHLISDTDKKEIVSADEVYFHASEDGKWSFFVKRPEFTEVEPEVSEPEYKESELDKEINESMKNKNRILTESQKRQITQDKEKVILESFASTFNKIKRIDESKINEEASGGIVGFDILNHEPFVNLPETRDEVDWSNRGKAKLPSLGEGDASMSILEKETAEEWVKEFISKYGEEPIFNITPEVKVLNKSFNDWQSNYISGKASELEKFSSKD
mgnify:FL=1